MSSDDGNGSSAGTNKGITEEILNLVSRGKPKARENGSRVTADDLLYKITRLIICSNGLLLL